MPPTIGSDCNRHQLRLGLIEFLSQRRRLRFRGLLVFFQRSHLDVKFPHLSLELLEQRSHVSEVHVLRGPLRTFCPLVANALAPGARTLSQSEHRGQATGPKDLLTPESALHNSSYPPNRFDETNSDPLNRPSRVLR